MNAKNPSMDDIEYTSLLPLSYMVPTFYPTLPGVPQAVGGAPQVRLADPDLQARAQRLINVLYLAATEFKDLDGMNDPEALKVFIAPEFYFRKASEQEAEQGRFLRSTSFGSYPESARFVLAEALHEAIHQSPLFKDWVVVAGTICSQLPRNPPHRLNLLNTALMLRGRRGAMDASMPYMLMEKHYISNIDGPPQNWHANLDPTTTYSFRLNPDQELDNLIFWDGMAVGLEVCLDHSMQVVANAMNVMNQSLGTTPNALDLQLVTSCGMSIVNQAVAVSDGSLVMLTDGMSHYLDRLPEPVFQIGRYDAAAGRVDQLDTRNFEFLELPRTQDYQVEYFGGRYNRLGRRQGVWHGEALPLSRG